MLILGIETSCDDTGAALVEVNENREFLVRKNLIASQADLHKKYGGIVPEVAAREHVLTIIPVLKELTTSEGQARPDAIAVTQGPGLITSLHVGVETAKALAWAWDIPLIGVNHIEGHIYSPLLAEEGVEKSVPLEFPAVALIVSGGHTELILMAGRGEYELIGRTRDDAAGEAFDKAAKMMGLPYPGGPEISRLAATGNPQAYELPKAMRAEDSFEFSYSGLKNSIRLLIEKKKSESPDWLRADQQKADLAASIERAIIDPLINKSVFAAQKYQPKTFILAGGVSANKKLRESLAQSLPKNIAFLCPRPEYTQDNAAMIAAAGYYHLARGEKNTPPLTAAANWELV